MEDDTLTIAVRLAMAALAGALIGLKRDLRHKSAGVRTHALVSIGTALMVVVVMPPGKLDTESYASLSRVIQGVLTGIGFLGAGVILRDPGMRHVSGLTTAATVWLTALLGVACGMGQYVPAVMALVLAVLAIAIGGRVEHALRYFLLRRKRMRRRRQPPA